MRPQSARSLTSLLPNSTSAPKPTWIIPHVPLAPSQGRQLSQRRRYTATAHIRASRGYHLPNVPSPITEPVYTLSLLTKSKVIDFMNHLRQTYYPKHLNVLPAHLTLFHALPESKLSSTIIPQILSTTAKTAPYTIHATGPSRMPRGVFVHAHHLSPTNWTKLLHADLQRAWCPFLSAQDRSKVQLHWTVMNKVQDQGKVSTAFEEIQALIEDKEADPEARADLQGSVEGLVLWRYEKGVWRDPHEFLFEQENEVLAREAWAEGGIRRHVSALHSQSLIRRYHPQTQTRRDPQTPVRRVSESSDRHIAGDKKARRVESNWVNTMRRVTSERPDDF